MKKKKHRIIRIILYSIIGVVAVSAVAITVCISLALQDNIGDKYTMTESDDGFLTTVLKGAFFGTETDVPELQINTYLNEKLCGDNKALKNIRVRFHKDAPCEIYARFVYKDIWFAIQAKAETKVNERDGMTSVRLSDVKLGELPIGQFVLNYVLNEVASKSDLLEYENEVLYIKSCLEYDFSSLTFTLQLEQLDPFDGGVKCRSNSMSAELFSALKKYILSDKGKELYHKIIGETAGNIADIVLPFIIR